MRQGADAIPGFLFTYANLSDQQFYAAKRYIHVTQEVTEDIFFVLKEAPVPTDWAGGISALAVFGNNRTYGGEGNNALNLLSGRISNPRSEDMAKVFCQGIDIDDNNDPAPENVPGQGETNYRFQ